jgi:hypothetical protein
MTMIAKSFVFFLLVAFSAVAVNGQVLKAGDVLDLKETAYDFGSIQQGRPAMHVFTIQNSASDTLRIQNVQASCGCTTPVWNKEPVAPGSKTTIQVGYNAAADGVFEKTVTVFYNDGKTKTLTIKGEVYKMPSTPAPLNSTVQLLKQINQ